ncbi:DUF805 domain-containing protein [Vibrio nigripulchritudo]|uniref:DUF805 domain-containing protein n=1 Tax=Vibrio nigripulchritudo TaxID=28173 RepID=UPI00190CAE54|nr:DUF805 domain-containing protein [Vibrio nigripulchritudo]BCL71434.1 DUF805 domain-containing protein [Vibrio nigripulchritudo]BDU32791.1 DUF805 domain-containing protein [Vibrio nigripulchritudo]
MSIKQYLFSFQGRVGRQVFWIWNAFYYLIVIGFSYGAGGLFPELGNVIAIFFLACMLYPDLAITAKRWHDRGKSVYWLALHIPVIAGRVLAPVAAPGVEMQTTAIETVASLLALVAGAWILVECGFLPGDQKENQYGKPPER